MTIKAAGDFTSRLHDRLEPGRKATVEGSYGMLDYRRGSWRQVWIAGGIGVTPFLSWLRSLDTELDRGIDFFYTVRTPEDALYCDEISAIAARHDELRVHLHPTAELGRLTASVIAETVADGLTESDVYLCGPVPMIKALENGLRQLGVPRSAIHYEEFSFR